jgi:hypothetical protein
MFQLIDVPWKITYYLSLWYRRRDVARRIAIFFSAATLAGAFGGILAYV